MASSTSTLTATYTTATQTSAPFTITSAIATSPTPTTSTPLEQKTAYLRSLRAAVLGAQEEINRELTQRMEEDNARAGGTAAAGKDAREEENYGEEMVEED